MYVDPSGHEYIVVSGGKYNTSESKSYQFEFTDTAIRQIANWRVKNKEETITWAIAMAGWSEDDITMFKDAVSRYNVNVIGFESVDSLVSYINDGSDNNRADDKITKFASFSHGLKGNVAYGYSHENASDLSFTIDKIALLDENAFNNASSIFYSCNTGTGGSDSFAQAWVNKTGGTTKAVVGRTDYAKINSGGFWNWDIALGWKIARKLEGGYSVPFPSFSLPKLGYQSNSKKSYWETFKPN